MNDDTEGLPVYACARGDLKGSDTPIGRAISRAQAAKMLNAHFSEHDGADYGLKGADIYFSRHLLAYFTEE